MDTFEFKIKCFCFIIFLIAFTLISKAQIIDPHAPTPAQPVTTHSFDYAIDGGEEFKAFTYIEEQQYFFYKASFDKKYATILISLLEKKLGKPAIEEENLLAWETIDGKLINSLFVAIENGNIKIKCRNLSNPVLKSLQELVAYINKVLGAKLIAQNSQNLLVKI